MERVRYCKEGAFAEDVAGTCGAFIWPPRSYVCSFCGREFGSAQALGGHMNVHRRDRARLKQFPAGLENDHIHDQDHQHQHQIPCTLIYNPDSTRKAFVSPLSGASRITEEENCQKPDCRKKENVNGKRWRSDELSLASFPFLTKLSKSTSMKKDHLQEEVKGPCIDLELRLGFSLF